MYRWPNHTIKIKSRKKTIEIKITLIDKKNNYITRVLTAKLQQRELSLTAMKDFTLHRVIEEWDGWLIARKMGNG